MAPGFTLPKPTVFLFQPTLVIRLLLYSASSRPHIIFNYRDANIPISVFILLFWIGVNLELGKPTFGNSQFCGFVSSSFSSSSSSSSSSHRREVGLCCGGDLSVGLGFWAIPSWWVLFFIADFTVPAKFVGAQIVILHFVCLFLWYFS